MTESDLEIMVIPDRHLELTELEETAQVALQHAQRLGADQAEVSVSIQYGLDVNVRKGEVETLQHSRDSGLGVSIFLGKAKGHATSGDMRPESVRLCVEKAVDIARFTQSDKCNGLAPANRLATGFPDLDLWHPRPMDVEAAVSRALECEAAGLAHPGIRNSDGATVSSHFGLNVYANSNGFSGRRDGTRYNQSCVLIAGEGDGMQRDYWYDSQRAFDDLEPIEQTGQKAAQRTADRLGARHIPTCRVPILLTPEVARGFIGHLVGAISGGALYRKASFLLDSAGQQLFPGWMNIMERPHLLRGPSSTAFDAEGVATADRNLVENGVLTGYVLSSYSARRLGLETTGNAGGVNNLVVSPGDSSAEELIRQMDKGLLVTEVMGQGVSLITGDYSRGAAGYWVENGEVQFPVDEVTIAGNLRDMFRTVVAVGSDIDRRSGIQTGSLLLDEMTVAGS